MNIIPSGDNHGGAVCDDPHVRFCERRMLMHAPTLFYGYNATRLGEPDFAHYFILQKSNILKSADCCWERKGNEKTAAANSNRYLSSSKSG